MRGSGGARDDRCSSSPSLVSRRSRFTGKRGTTGGELLAGMRRRDFGGCAVPRNLVPRRGTCPLKGALLTDPGGWQQLYPPCPRSPVGPLLADTKHRDLRLIRERGGRNGNVGHTRQEPCLRSGMESGGPEGLPGGRAATPGTHGLPPIHRRGFRGGNTGPEKIPLKFPVDI